MNEQQRREIYGRLSGLDSQHSIKMCHIILTRACAGFMTDEEIETYRRDLLLKPEQAKRLLQCLRNQEDHPQILDRYAWHLETLTVLGWFTIDDVKATPTIEQARIMLERYEFQHSHRVLSYVAKSHSIDFILHEDDLSESSELLNGHYGLDVNARLAHDFNWNEYKSAAWEVIEQQCRATPTTFQDICDLLHSFDWLEGQAEYKQDDFGSESTYEEYAAKLCTILASVGFIPIYDDSVGYAILMLASLVQDTTPQYVQPYW